jgi:hypothetical protein
MSSTPTPEAPSSYLAKDGVYYDSYQKMVHANVRHNQARLKERGLDGASFARILPVRPKRRIVTPPRSEPPRPIRRSSRKRHASPESSIGRQLVPLIELAHNPRRNKTIRTTKKTLPFPALSSDQRKELLGAKGLSHGGDGSVWQLEMEEYLDHVENLSAPNRLSVMRQVRKLVSRQGITYSRWEHEVAFLKGTRVHLWDDFEALYDQAVEFENEHGHDLGNGTLLLLCSRIGCFSCCPMPRRQTQHSLPLTTAFTTTPDLALFWISGWLLRHPIKKLLNFQRHYYEKSKHVGSKK